MQLATIFTLLGTLALTAPALAGPGLSGGGKGIVCRDNAGKVQSVELLDLWEAEHIHELKPQPMQGSVAQRVDAGLRALSLSLSSDTFRWVYQDHELKGTEALFQGLRIQASQFFQTPGEPQTSKLRKLRNVRLTPTEDSFEAALPSDCGVEQIVHYQDEDYLGGTILVNQDLVDAMDPLNQAALVVHESLYKFLRGEYGETSSLRVRRAVGLVFSGHTFSTMDARNLPSRYYVCECKSDPKHGPLNAPGVSKIYLLVDEKASDANGVIFTAQASSLGGIPFLDEGPFRGAFPERAMGAKDFSDLSTAESDPAELGLSTSLVQAELIPLVRIEEAGPGGHLVISVGAKPSVFLPNGLEWQTAACEYHAGK